VSDENNKLNLETFAEQKIKDILPWREQPENKEIWSEAVEGYKNGIPGVVIAEWLQKEHDCPLLVDSIRKGLRVSLEKA
tara:strand:+ start:136 stop:372 length:237 start_codon:yes stop_codon:yes gene_type:complete